MSSTAAYRSQPGSPHGTGRYDHQTPQDRTGAKRRASGESGCQVFGPRKLTSAPRPAASTRSPVACSSERRGLRTTSTSAWAGPSNRATTDRTRPHRRFAAADACPAPSRRGPPEPCRHPNNPKWSYPISIPLATQPDSHGNLPARCLLQLPRALEREPPLPRDRSRKRRVVHPRFPGKLPHRTSSLPEVGGERHGGMLESLASEVNRGVDMRHQRR